MLNSLRQLHRHSTSACLVTHCSKENVSLRLPRSGCVCVDCDKCLSFTPNEPKPDYIGLMVGQSSSQTYWFVLEMKSSVRRPNEVIRQLQAGVDKIRNSPAFRLNDSPETVKPYIVHGRGRTRVADRARRYVTYGSKKFEVRNIRSGGSL